MTVIYLSLSSCGLVSFTLKRDGVLRVLFWTHVRPFHGVVHEWTRWDNSTTLLLRDWHMLTVFLLTCVCCRHERVVVSRKTPYAYRYDNCNVLFWIYTRILQIILVSVKIKSLTLYNGIIHFYFGPKGRVMWYGLRPLKYGVVRAREGPPTDEEQRVRRERWGLGRGDHYLAQGGVLQDERAGRGKEGGGPGKTRGEGGLRGVQETQGEEQPNRDPLGL